MREWKPGDLAVTAQGLRALRMGTQFIDTKGAPWSDERHPDNLRPLVVIDPEANPHHEGTAGWIDWIEDQYRAQTKPPKPPEPQGLGAVVECADGRQFVVDFVSKDGAPRWYGPTSDRVRYERPEWEHIPAVKVLSEGWSP